MKSRVKGSVPVGETGTKIIPVSASESLHDTFAARTFRQLLLVIDAEENEPVFVGDMDPVW
jgi:hypothetical protein